jgi:hypothetical protein
LVVLAAMTDSLLQTLAIGVVLVLLTFELFLALASWLETGGGSRATHGTPLLFTRPFAIRDHFVVRQHQLNELRRQYPILRAPGHGRQVRDAIRHLQPTDLTPSLVECSSCRGSRMRGIPRCPACGQHLIAPAHGSLA